MARWRESPEAGQATVEWLGVFLVVAVMVAVVSTSSIPRQVAGRMRCQVSEVFGSSSGCSAGGGTVSAGPRAVTTAAHPGGTAADPGGGVFRTDSGGPPDTSTWQGRADNYCLKHPGDKAYPTIYITTTMSCAKILEASHGLDPFTRGCLNALGIAPLVGGGGSLFNKFMSGDIGGGISKLFSTAVDAVKDGGKMTFGAALVTCYAGGAHLHVPGLG